MATAILVMIAVTGAAGAAGYSYFTLAHAPTGQTNPSTGSAALNSASSGSSGSQNSSQSTSLSSQGPIVQSCADYAWISNLVSCSFPRSVTAGDLLIVEAVNVPSPALTSTISASETCEIETYTTPVSTTTGNGSETCTGATPSLVVSDSMGNNYTLVSNQLIPGHTYALNVFWTIARSSGPDNVTVAGIANYPDFVVHEFTGVTSLAAVYLASGNSTSASVKTFLPPSGSVVFAAVLPNDKLAGANPEWVVSGPGMTPVGVYIDMLADELSLGPGPTTCPFQFGVAVQWTEAVLVLE
ncbi:MAG: hypothetical protein OK441_01400 [Thaumarchaeota archaeon]|nr:hypothetical protein [Nitrososphaerota archaeon]